MNLNVGNAALDHLVAAKVREAAIQDEEVKS